MKLINTNRFYLPGQKIFLHLATVHIGVREFLCFANTKTTQVYIEEISGGHLEFIEDDSLVSEIQNFLTERKVLVMNKPLLPDDVWYNSGHEKR